MICHIWILRDLQETHHKYLCIFAQWNTGILLPVPETDRICSINNRSGKSTACRPLISPGDWLNETDSLCKAASTLHSTGWNTGNADIPYHPTVLVYSCLPVPREEHNCTWKTFDSNDRCMYIEHGTVWIIHSWKCFEINTKHLHSENTACLSKARLGGKHNINS